MTDTPFLPKNKMSLQDYLTFQESEERKYEFIDGEVRMFHEPGGYSATFPYKTKQTPPARIL